MLLDPPQKNDDPAHVWWNYLDPASHLPTRYALIFGGAGVAFTFIVCFIAANLFERQIRDHFGPRLEALAYQISDKLDRGMNERYREVQIAAGAQQIRDSAAPVSEKRRVLSAMYETLPDYGWIGFADASGKVTAATREWFEGTDVTDLDWFNPEQQKPTGGSLHVLPELANLIPGSLEEKPRFIAVSSPVFALTTAKFSGFVGAYVNWDWVRRTIASVVPESPSPDRIMVTVYDLNGKVLFDSHRVAGLNRTETLPPPVVPDAAKYRGFTIEETNDGEYLTGYIRSRGYQSFHYLNWFFAVRQPAITAFAPVIELQRSIIAVGFSTSALLGLVGWIFAHRTTRRLRALASASDRIREGDISSLVPVFKSDDEMSRMAESIGRTVEDLRVRNTALTEELQRLRGLLKNSTEVSQAPKPALLSPDEEARALNPVRKGPRG